MEEASRNARCTSKPLPIGNRREAAEGVLGKTPDWSAGKCEVWLVGGFFVARDGGWARMPMVFSLPRVGLILLVFDFFL
jgi:hypothetical protein